VTKLNQIVAVVEGGLKQKTATQATNLANNLHKRDLFNGFTKSFEPLTEDGETFPPERQLVQQNVQQGLDALGKTLGRLYDAVATRDVANQDAAASVQVDNAVILFDLPVPTLLYLRNQLAELRPVLAKLPTLDPAEEWHLVDGVYRTDPVRVARPRKIPTVLVKYPATKEHAAQTEVYMRDETLGHWVTTKLSTALPVQRKVEILERLDKLSAGIQVAIEKANDIEVEQQHFAEDLFGYLLG
jgi:hypothetical protein